MASASRNGSPKTKYRPWLSVWVDPYTAIRKMLASGSDDYLHRLMMLWGMSTVAFGMSQVWAGSEPHPVGVMIMFLLAGPIAGVLGGYILSAAVRKVSGLFGVPESGSKDMQLTISWTGLPFITGNILFAIIYVLAFTMAQPILIPVAFVVNGVLKCWGVFSRSMGIAAALNISGAMAFIIYLVSVILVWIPVTAVALLYYYLMKGTLGL